GRERLPPSPERDRRRWRHGSRPQNLRHAKRSHDCDVVESAAMSAPDPLLAAGNATVRRTLAEMRQTVAEFPPDGLNWKPAGEDTNSMAVLATHSLHSTRSWLCTALGEALPDRDRDSEFRVAADDPAVLLELFDRMSSECNALFERERAMD